MSYPKKHSAIVVVGHADAGKSTITARLLFELRCWTERDFEKTRKEAQDLGREVCLFAFHMDKTKDERERGVTIACTTRDCLLDLATHINLVIAQLLMLQVAEILLKI